MAAVISDRASSTSSELEELAGRENFLSDEVVPIFGELPSPR